MKKQIFLNIIANKLYESGTDHEDADQEAEELLVKLEAEGFDYDWDDE